MRYFSVKIKIQNFRNKKFRPFGFKLSQDSLSVKSSFSKNAKKSYKTIGTKNLQRNVKKFRIQKLKNLFSSNRSINMLDPFLRMKKIGRNFGVSKIFKEIGKPQITKKFLDLQTIETNMPLDFGNIFKNEKKNLNIKNKNIRNISLGKIKNNNINFEKKSRISLDSHSKGRKDFYFNIQKKKMNLL